MKRKIVIKLGAFVLLFYLISFILARVFNIGIEEVQLLVQSAGIFAPIVFSLLIFLGLTVPLNPISDFLLINIGVILFPPYVAIICTFIAHSFAIIVNYFIGRKYGKRVIDRAMNEESSKYLDKYLKKLTIKKLFIIRFVVPLATIFGADIVSYVSGMQRLPFVKYFLVSIIPWTILNIIYYTFSSYLINFSIFLYFLPVLLIVVIPLGIIYLVRRKVFI